MDILAALNDRLVFIQRFYFTAAPSFEAIQRKCIPRHDRHHDDPPDQCEKWQDATKGLEVLGQCSLSLVAKAIEDYLHEFILHEVGAVPALTGKSKFEKYENFLLHKTTFRWEGCPVGRDRIEQINLSRNDFMHDPLIDSSQPKQSERHFEKHPSSRFSVSFRQACGPTSENVVPGSERASTPGWLESGMTD